MNSFIVDCTLIVIIAMFDCCVGLQVTEDIHQGKATWQKLFEPWPFFNKYK